MASKADIRWRVIGGLGFALLALLAFLFAPRPMAVELAAVARGPIAETVQDQGEARVRRSYTVAAPFAGRVERLPLEVGDRVEAGTTVVARMRPSSPTFLDPRARAQAQAAVTAARASLAAAVSDRDRASAEAQRAGLYARRIDPLAGSGTVSRQAVDDARAAAATAAAALASASAVVETRKAELASAEAALSRPLAPDAQEVAITAPASGVVTQVPDQSERTIAAGAPLVEIGAVGGLEAQIEFLSQDAVRIRPGQRAEIFNWGGPGAIPAQVRLVQPSGYTKVSALGVEEQRALVMLQFTGPASGWAGLAPGYRVWGRVYLREAPSAVLAPVGALVRTQGGWAVFRLERGRARLRPVKVGVLTDQSAEILDGVSPGDRLVNYPSDQVRDGMRIKADRKR